jgi:hypothetical protein
MMYKNVIVEEWTDECGTVAVDASKDGKEVEATAEDLEPTSSYEFKVVASNADGESESDVACYDTQV